MSSKTLQDGQISDFTPIELLVCRRKQQKAVQERISYLKNMVGVVRAKNYDVLEGEFLIYGDSEEVVNAIIDSAIGDSLAKYAPFINQIHLTDQRGYLNYPLVLQAEIKVSDSREGLEAAEKLLKLFLLIADKAANLKLSAGARQKAEKNRKDVNREKAKLKAEEMEEFKE